MSQLTIALDKAVATRNDKHINVSSPDRKLNPVRKPPVITPVTGNNEMANLSTAKRQSVDPGYMDGEMRKQMDVNRRLNDLLN